MESLSPAKAALTGSATGLLLGGVVYALERSALAFAAVAVGVTIMLFVMFAFPEAANQRSRNARAVGTVSALVRQLCL